MLVRRRPCHERRVGDGAIRPCPRATLGGPGGCTANNGRYANELRIAHENRWLPLAPRARGPIRVVRYLRRVPTLTAGAPPEYRNALLARKRARLRRFVQRRRPRWFHSRSMTAMLGLYPGCHSRTVGFASRNAAHRRIRDLTQGA